MSPPLLRRKPLLGKLQTAVDLDILEQIDQRVAIAQTTRATFLRELLEAYLANDSDFRLSTNPNPKPATI